MKEFQNIDTDFHQWKDDWSEKRQQEEASTKVKRIDIPLTTANARTWRTIDTIVENKIKT